MFYSLWNNYSWAGCYIIVSVGLKNMHLIPDLLNSLHGREDVYMKIENIGKLDFQIRFRI